MSIDFESLHSLPVADKLQLVERLWDDIADSAGTAGLHEWHKDEINRRMAELEAAPVRLDRGATLDPGRAAKCLSRSGSAPTS